MANIRRFIRAHVNMAKHFEGLVGMDQRFEIVVPRHFSLVCFRILSSAMGLSIDNEGANKLNRKLLESINLSGRVYMTHAVVGEAYLI